MLPLLPLGDLDFRVVWSSQSKVWIYDDFIHLKTGDNMDKTTGSRILIRQRGTGTLIRVMVTLLEQGFYLTESEGF